MPEPKAKPRVQTVRITIEVEVENGPLDRSQRWNLAEQIAAGDFNKIFRNAGCNVADYWINGEDDERE